MLGQGRNMGVAGVRQRGPVLETKAGEWGAISEGPKVPSPTVGLTVELWIRGRPQPPNPPAAPGGAVHRNRC